jgi:hypothetical protein
MRKGAVMVRLWLPAIASLALFLITGSARSSGCCDETPTWKLQQTEFNGYNNSAVMVPGNDTRVNLYWMLADRHAPSGLKIAPPSAADGAGPVVITPLFQYRAFAGSIVMADETDYLGQSPTRCNSSSAGSTAFVAALNADSSVAAADKRVLTDLRRRFDGDACDKPEANAAIAAATQNAAAPAKPFALYLQGAKAFYDGDLETAAPRFAAVKDAKNAWLREAALYMVARTALGVAQAGAYDDYGSLNDPAKRDKATSTAAEAAFTAYLSAYPKGDYAVSARGLLRRVYWLAGDNRKLAAEYGRLFALRDATARGINNFTLVEEIDQKFPTALGAKDFDNPALLAMIDLMRMRGEGHFDRSDHPVAAITATEIEGQRAAFAKDQPLFDYVMASHAMFVAKNPADVLRLIPDATAQKSFSYIQFSRQMLRGFALEALKDRNTRGFWLNLFGGATQPYQRQALELALAMHDERTGGFARIFDVTSQIRDPYIRGILLGYTAGPDVLRQQATSKTATSAERDTALFVLLYKQLGRGFYDGFLSDLRLVKPSRGDPATIYGPTQYRGLGTIATDDAPPLLFAKPANLGDFVCPQLGQTVAMLAKNPRAPTAQLCVGEFMRVNGFDHYDLDIALPKDELGGAPSLFPGKPYSRLETYKDVMANAAASPRDKAYALYRAVNCYAPGGSNDCGGVDVDKPVRRGWFQRLKREYPKSEWAQSLNYYW